MTRTALILVAALALTGCADVTANVAINVAAENGNELASKNIKIYAKRLDKSDLRKAQKLSRRCRRIGGGHRRGRV